MQRFQHGYLLFIILLLLNIESIASTAPLKPCYNWNGFYLGATAGGVASNFNTNTYTQAGSLLDPIQANAVNNVGKQKIDRTGFLGGLEAGYNYQFNRFLIGLETDIQTLSTNGETNSGAVPYPNQPGNQFVITSYGNNNWLLSARPRIGLIANNWLFYATGGLGLALVQSDFLFTDKLGASESKRVSEIKPGYVVGAGIETGLTNQISLKAEYLFANFNNMHASNMNNNIPSGQTFSNSVNLKSNIIRLGVNYRFDNPTNRTSSNLQLFPALLNTCQWETEICARLFLSSGIDGAPQPLLAGGMPLISRLIFSDLSAISGETFARVDHANGLFVKGYLGVGSVTDGQLNDEDFPAGGAYSNTLSSALGNLSYATADVGYSFIKTPSAKIGAFIGYNYYDQNLNTYSCRQLAGAMVCSPSGEAANFLGISEDDTFNSLRLGLSTQFDLTNQLTLTSEAAYIPIVNFEGTDLHNARQLIIPEQSSHGDGAMLEAILNYQFCPCWNIGLGGRYWMWNMHDGSVLFKFLGENETFTQPARYNTDRYGVFLQLSYHPGKSCNTDIFTTPVCWKGVFVGGHLGGAWGKSYWSDPFGSTISSDNFVNVAGFGDRIRSTGPLGGIDLKCNWQTGQFVYGIGGTISVTDIRGENTLFSGIGGVNGQTITNYLGTIVGRAGLACNRSLFYVNGGPAILNIQYLINGNTGVLTLGSENQTINRWGWTGGAGIEHALTDHWTTSIEYDYVYIPRRVISFSSVGLINNARIASNQTMNIFKVGLSYKFDVLR